MNSTGTVKNKRVLVTGAAGFIGSHLTGILLKGDARVTALVRYTSGGGIGWLDDLPSRSKRRLEIIYGDIRDPDTCRLAVDSADYIFHLAAQIAIPYSYLAPRDFLAVNGTGTLNLLAAAKAKGIKKFLHVSTSEVYGSAQYIPMDENHPQNSQSPYAASKIAADKMALAFHHSYRLPLTIVRPFNTFGPRQSARAILPTIILQALRGRTVRLGNVHPGRDMNYVADIAHGMIAAGIARDTDGLTLNLATGRVLTVRQMVTAVSDVLGKKLTVRAESRRKRPKASEVDRLVGDASRAGEILGYKPQHSFTAGLKKTIRFFEKRIDRYKPEDYQI